MRPIRDPNGPKRSEVRGELSVLDRYSADEIAAMTLGEYAALREKLLAAAVEPTREYGASRWGRKRAVKKAQEIEKALAQQEIRGMLNAYMEFDQTIVPDTVQALVMSEIPTDASLWGQYL